MPMTVAIIGGGNMCRAMLPGIRRANPDAEIVISTPNPEKCSDLAKPPKIKVEFNNPKVASADIIFLTVKPDKIKEVSEEIRKAISHSKKKPCIVFVAAGVSIETLKKFFGEEVQIVRAMPNIGAELGGPPIPVCCAENVSSENQNRVIDIFSNMGQVKLVPLKEEEMFHWYTVELGCMPGRIADFVDATAKHAAKVLGCSEKEAEKQVLSFLEIHLKLLKKNPGMPSRKILESVRTPGGITDIIVRSLDLFEQTVEAGKKAYAYSVALGKKVAESALALEEAPKLEEVESFSEKTVENSVLEVNPLGGITFHPKKQGVYFSYGKQQGQPNEARFFSTERPNKELGENPSKQPSAVSGSSNAESKSFPPGVFFGSKSPSNLNPRGGASVCTITRVPTNSEVSSSLLRSMLRKVR